MKKIIFIFLICNLQFVICNLLAQPVTQEWVARWGQSYPYGSGGSGVKTDNLGFIYVLADTGNGFGFLKYDQNGNLQFSTTYWPSGWYAGRGGHFDVTPAGDVYVTGGVTQGSYNWIYTVKFNANGAFQWGKPYNLDDADGEHCIKADNAGNVIIAGGSLIGDSNFALIVKYNSSGDILWTRHFNNGQGYAYINNFVLDNTNEIYAAGDIGTGTFGNPNKAFFMKYNSAGSLLWITTFNLDTNWSAYGRGIDRDAYGNIYVIGLQVTSNSNIDTYLLKLNNSGDTIWSRLYPGYNQSYSPYGPVIGTTGDEIYYTNTYRPANDNYIATFKYDSSGAFQWIQTYNGGVPGTDANNQPATIKMDRYDNIYVCGSADYPTSGNNFVTLKYLPTGTLQWIAAYTGRTTNADDQAEDLISDTNLNIYVAGWSKRQNSGYDDAVTIKYSQPVGLRQNNSQLPSSYRLYQNYPNPFNPITIITYEVQKLSDIKLVIYNILGAAVKTVVNGKQQASTYSVAVNMGIFASGVYFYRLFANGNVIDTKKLVLLK